MWMKGFTAKGSEKLLFSFAKMILENPFYSLFEGSKEYDRSISLPNSESKNFSSFCEIAFAIVMLNRVFEILAISDFFMLKRIAC
jgi:hypothetical protein